MWRDYSSANGNFNVSRHEKVQLLYFCSEIVLMVSYCDEDVIIACYLVSVQSQLGDDIGTLKLQPGNTWTIYLNSDLPDLLLEGCEFVQVKKVQNITFVFTVLPAPVILPTYQNISVVPDKPFNFTFQCKVTGSSAKPALSVSTTEQNSSPTISAVLNPNTCLYESTLKSGKTRVCVAATSNLWKNPQITKVMCTFPRQQPGEYESVELYFSQQWCI